MLLPMNKVSSSKTKSSFQISSTAPVPTAPIVNSRQFNAERRIADPSSSVIYSGRLLNISFFEYRVT